MTWMPTCHEFWEADLGTCVESWVYLVQDGPKLLDDGGEVSKSQRKRLVLRFPAVISLHLTENLQGGQLPLMLWCWHVGILSQKRQKELGLLSRSSFIDN